MAKVMGHTTNSFKSCFSQDVAVEMYHFIVLTISKLQRTNCHQKIWANLLSISTTGWERKLPSLFNIHPWDAWIKIIIFTVEWGIFDKKKISFQSATLVEGKIWLLSLVFKFKSKPFHNTERFSLRKHFTIFCTFSSQILYEYHVMST